VCDQRDALQAEMLAQVVEILDLARGDETCGVGRQLRTSATTLIVVDDDVTVPEHQREIVVDRPEVEPGSAVNRDDRVHSGAGMPGRFVKEAGPVRDSHVPALLTGERGGKEE
jgi:hypothetical protein